ncbi:glycosyltransferase family A protein [Xanthomarina sp. GH4-25]
MKSQLQEDSRYRSVEAKNYDASWQAIHKGYIGEEKTIQSISKVPIYDEYVFIRKYFSAFWVFYVLLIRLFSFKNPFKELKAFYETRQIKRSDYLKSPLIYEDWQSFQSILIKESPLVSVIIPTLNRYTYLKDVLKDFEQQDYKNFEVIIVDQSDLFNLSFYKDFHLNLKVIKQQEKALWLARNTAVKVAKGHIIALSEDDVRINKDWISSHLKCLDYFKADISAGVFYPLGKQLPYDRSFFSIASQFATGNAMLYKYVFEKVGLFDRQFEKQRMGDGEFGLRAYLYSFSSVSNPKAACIDIKANAGGLREMGSWDAFRTKKWFAPRPIPSVLYFYRSYFGNQAARFALSRTVPLSIMPYQFKRNKPMMILGVFVSLLLLPLVLFQVCKSWRLASEKLKQGPLIEKLE